MYHIRQTVVNYLVKMICTFFINIITLNKCQLGISNINQKLIVSSVGFSQKRLVLQSLWVKKYELKRKRYCNYKILYTTMISQPNLVNISQY